MRHAGGAVAVVVDGGDDGEEEEEGAGRAGHNVGANGEVGSGSVQRPVVLIAAVFWVAGAILVVG